jgi:hypothetical protein
METYVYFYANSERNLLYVYPITGKVMEKIET